jgi:hypothetical protein
VGTVCVGIELGVVSVGCSVGVAVGDVHPATTRAIKVTISISMIFFTVSPLYQEMKAWFTLIKVI